MIDVVVELDPDLTPALFSGHLSEKWFSDEQLGNEAS